MRNHNLRHFNHLRQNFSCNFHLTPAMITTYNILSTLTTGAGDMGIFQTKIKIINKFLAYFKPVFSNKQFISFCFIIYALCKDYRRLSLSAIAKAVPISYQRLQYLVCDAKWSTHELNTLRLSLIQRQRTTASTSSGVGVNQRF